MPCVVTSVASVILRTTQKRGESFGISRIGNKIKGVFKSSAMEGAMLPSYNLNEGEDDFVSKCFKSVLKSLLLFGVFSSLFENVKLLLFLLSFFAVGFPRAGF